MLKLAMFKATLLALSARLMLTTQTLSLLFLPLFESLRRAKKWHRNMVYRYKSMT
jgi:hypothetical protein